MSEPDNASRQTSLVIDRLVLQLSGGHGGELALETAVCLAQAFDAEIESLFVESSDLHTLAQLPFARETLSTSGRSRSLSPESIERDMRLAAAGLRRRLEAISRRTAVPVRFSIMRDEPVQAVAAVCASCQGAHLVALAGPWSVGEESRLHELMTTVPGLAGVVLVSDRRQRTSGPVIAVVEDAPTLPRLLDAAHRLAAALNEPVLVLLAADDRGQVRGLETMAARLAKVDPAIRIAAIDAAHGEPAVIAEALRRLRGSFIVARYGGQLAPAAGTLTHLLPNLECPLLILRDGPT
jgi:hypothetical protein